MDSLERTLCALRTLPSPIPGHLGHIGHIVRGGVRGRRVEVEVDAVCLLHPEQVCGTGIEDVPAVPLPRP